MSEKTDIKMIIENNDVIVKCNNRKEAEQILQILAGVLTRLGGGEVDSIKYEKR